MAEERPGELLRLIDEFTDHACIVATTDHDELIIRIEQANAVFVGRLEQRLTREQEIRLRDALTAHLEERDVRPRRSGR